jgi:hypothetical protein
MTPKLIYQFPWIQRHGTCAEVTASSFDRLSPYVQLSTTGCNVRRNTCTNYLYCEICVAYRIFLRPHHFVQMETAICTKAMETLQRMTLLNHESRNYKMHADILREEFILVKSTCKTETKMKRQPLVRSHGKLVMIMEG